MWSRIRKPNGTQTGSAAPVVYDNNGNVETDPKQVANIIAQYFSTVGQINNNATFKDIKNNVKIGQYF